MTGQLINSLGSRRLRYTADLICNHSTMVGETKQRIYIIDKKEIPA